MATKSFSRIFLALGFLLIACLCEGSHSKEHDHGIIPLGWKFGFTPYEKVLQKVLRILHKISWIFPDEHGNIKLFNEKSVIGAGLHWQADLITILQDIMGLASLAGNNVVQQVPQFQVQHHSGHRRHYQHYGHDGNYGHHGHNVHYGHDGHGGENGHNGRSGYDGEYNGHGGDKGHSGRGGEREHSEHGGANRHSGRGGEKGHSGHKGSKGHHKHHGHVKPDKENSTILDVVSTLMKNNVGTLDLKAESPVQGVIKQLHNTFSGDVLNQGHIPGFTDIVKNVLKVSNLPLPGLPLPFQSRFRRSNWHSSSSWSQGSSSFSESKSQEQLPESFLRKFANVALENNPVAHPERLKSLASAISSTDIFSNIESAFKTITNTDFDIMKPAMPVFQIVTKVLQWFQKVLLPGFLRFSNLLSFHVPFSDLASFWTWPFKIIHFESF